MKRLLLAILIAPLFCIAAAAQNAFTTPGGSIVNGGVGMCLNASGQAVACSAVGALATPNNIDTGALITLTAASAGVNSADQINNTGRGINVVINITAITGTTPTLTVTLQGKDTASGQYYNILVSTALNATGTTVLQAFPGATALNNIAANALLPHTWRVITAIGGTTPAVTATIGASVIE